MNKIISKCCKMTFNKREHEIKKGGEYIFWSQKEKKTNANNLCKIGFKLN